MVAPRIAQNYGKVPEFRNKVRPNCLNQSDCRGYIAGAYSEGCFEGDPPGFFRPNDEFEGS